MLPKFSIIIPVYNVEKYLSDCLDSVLNQTYQDYYEVICINDGSTDQSLAILEEYEKKADNLTIISQENKGPSEARNTGIRQAKGDYIWFIDSDDWIERNSLEVLSKYINGEDFICFNGRKYFDHKRILEDADSGVEEELTGWDYHNKYSLVNSKIHFLCVMSRIFQRDFILKNNLFFEPGLYHEDNLFMPLVCYYADKVKVIPDTLYIYRVREGSISQTPSKKHVFDMIIIANKLSEFFIPKNDLDKSALYRGISGRYFFAYMPPQSNILNNDFREVKNLINWDSFKTVSIYPRHKRIYTLIRLHPALFKFYLKIERLSRKRLLKNR